MGHLIVSLIMQTCDVTVWFGLYDTVKRLIFWLRKITVYMVLSCIRKEIRFGLSDMAD